jgi:asparagine synthase (glutamine-hydrolysing)
VTALSGFWARRSAVDPVRACERMLAAQAVYAPAARPVCSSAGDVAVGRRLFPLLPEDRHDRAPQQGGGGRWTLVADLRLDNREDLCEQLAIDPAPARSLADAAILMRAVERWGESAAERLVGDFAFAAWDRDRERLILARDFMGNRPLHFHRGAGFFAFASMAKGLHALPEIPCAPDERAMKRFLALVPGDGTQSYFEGIESVPGGHMCIATRNGVEIRRYWNPSSEVLRLKRPEEYREAVREAMDRAVSVRLRGTGGRVASHLSGGLDSSTVTATAARLLAGRDGKVTAFTSVPREGYDEPFPSRRFADEGAHAAAVAELYPNIDHVLIRSGDRSPLAALDRNFYLYEQPVLNLCNAVWSDAINDSAKESGLSVLLTGQMGNLSFSYNGCEWLPQLLRQGRILKLAREALRLRRHGFGLQSTAAHTFGPYLPRGLWSAINRWRGRGMDFGDYSAAHPATAGEARAEMDASGRDISRRPSRDAFASRLRVLGDVDFGASNKGTLGGWGIDTRDPTADRRLVELCLRIPVEQYLRGGRIRALARDTFADRLPPMILDETRKGLQAADWHEGFTTAQGRAEEEVERLAALGPAQGMFDLERMRRLVSDWPEDGWNRHHVQSGYRLALLRGISGGHFLRKSLRAN